MSKRGYEGGESSRSSKRIKPAGELIEFKEVIQTPWNFYVQQSFTDFDLEPFLQDRLQKFGYLPSRIQSLSLPIILDPKRVPLIAQGHFGSGKSLALLIGMMNQVDPGIDNVQCICVCPNWPTIFQLVSKLHNFKVKHITSGMMIGSKTPTANFTGHIVFGTPITIFEAIRDSKLQLTNVRVLALDDSDILLQHKDGEINLNGIWEALRGRFGPPGPCQVLVFSSTLSSRARHKFENIFREREFTKILLQQKELLPTTVKHLKVHMESDDSKINFITDNLLDVSPLNKAIIFVNSRNVELQVANLLRAKNCRVVTYKHSTNVDEFKVLSDSITQPEIVLVTTDILSHGFNTPLVGVIVNYEMPSDASGSAVETYLHRGGRTGRFGQKGVVVNLLSTSKDCTILENIEKQLTFNCTQVPPFCRDRLVASMN